MMQSIFRQAEEFGIRESIVEKSSPPFFIKSFKNEEYD
jgi:hypothetical protein